jgi:hypothetical protein
MKLILTYIRPTMILILFTNWTTTFQLQQQKSEFKPDRNFWGQTLVAVLAIDQEGANVCSEDLVLSLSLSIGTKDKVVIWKEMKRLFVRW